MNREMQNQQNRLREEMAAHSATKEALENECSRLRHELALAAQNSLKYVHRCFFVAPTVEFFLCSYLLRIYPNYYTVLKSFTVKSYANYSLLQCSSYVVLYTRNLFGIAVGNCTILGTSILLYVLLILFNSTSSAQSSSDQHADATASLPKTVCHPFSKFTVCSSSRSYNILNEYCNEISIGLLIVSAYSSYLTAPFAGMSNVTCLSHDSSIGS